MNAGNDVLFVLQNRRFGGNQTENNLFALCHVPERLETAGALVIELQIKGVCFFIGEQIRCNSIVCTGASICGMVIAAAYMGCNGQICRFAFHSEVVDTQILFCFAFQRYIVMLAGVPVIGIAEHAPCAVIKLNIAAACIVQLLNDRAVCGGNILHQILHVRINRRRLDAVVLTV